MVIEKPRAPIHVHTYGGETPFFRGLAEGKLLATRCVNPKCVPAGKSRTRFLPPRVYCPDCLERTEWEGVSERARKTAKVHTHITVEHAGAINRVPMPCELISVEIDGVATILMSQLRGLKASIGLPVEPVFATANPTFTILHLAGMAGLQTFCLFGPTDPAIWRPLGPRVHTLRHQPLADLENGRVVLQLPSGLVKQQLVARTDPELLAVRQVRNGLGLCPGETERLLGIHMCTMIEGKHRKLCGCAVA